LFAFVALSLRWIQQLYLIGDQAKTLRPWGECENNLFFNEQTNDGLRLGSFGVVSDVVPSHSAWSECVLKVVNPELDGLTT
jgi:hypothetical protein